MPKPLIGISVNPRYPKVEQSYDRLAHSYVNAVQAAGGIPVMLPTELRNDEIKALRERLDGILLSGGGDIDPKRFGGTPNRKIGNVHPARDELEYALVGLSVETDWPLLGICRGMQVINAALGGTLYTDIPAQYPTEINHDTTDLFDSRDFLAHEVRIVEDTRLSSIIARPTVRVNSFHHQAVLALAKKLKANAYAEDGLIEGVELPEHRFLIGVQWHPECLPDLPEQRKLFKAFIQVV